VESETNKTNFFECEAPAKKVNEKCPYQAYTNMCKLVPADNNDPAFLICHGHVRKVLTYVQYQRKLELTCTY
jgi:hypothetical protein